MNFWYPVLLMVSTLAGEPDLAQRAETLFDQGQTLSLEDPEAARKAFHEAAEIFTLLSEDKTLDPARTHMNAGNAWFFAEELGLAIYHYRRAEQLLPLDAAVQQNLAYARSQSLDAFDSPRGRSRLGTLIPPLSALILAFGGVNTLLFAGLAVRRLGMKPKGFRLVLGFDIALGLLALAAITAPHLHHDGVIVAREASPRMGNNDAYPSAFSMPLHAGTEFKVVEQRGEWVQIEVETGDKGWLPIEAVKLL